MEFETMEFRKGMNLTVRNGHKWSDLVVGDIISIQKSGSGVTCCKAVVNDVKVVNDIQEIPECDLELEHSPSCRYPLGLGAALNRAYGAYHWGPALTLVFFTIIESHRGWIGVDLDGTLAQYNGWNGPEHIGNPVPAMVARLKRWIEEGRDVRIFTARISHDGTPQRIVDAISAGKAIRRWCEVHIGQTIPITNVKDYEMIELWDDRCVQVIPNTGARADGR